MLYQLPWNGRQRHSLGGITLRYHGKPDQAGLRINGERFHIAHADTIDIDQGRTCHAKGHRLLRAHGSLRLRRGLRGNRDKPHRKRRGRDQNQENGITSFQTNLLPQATAECFGRNF